MMKRDRLGLVILIALLVTLALALVWATKPLGPAKSPENSYFVQQRLINIQKSNR